MTRAFLIVVALASTASAQKTTSPKQAKAQTTSAFTKALGKLKLKTIKLATMPADAEEATGDTMFVGTVVDTDPTFVVDANKAVFRVDRSCEAERLPQGTGQADPLEAHTLRRAEGPHVQGRCRGRVRRVRC
jgi:hypothetical protein